VPAALGAIRKEVTRISKLSIRVLWRFYKQIATQHGTHTRRELIQMQDAFYGGARSVLKVLDHMLEHSDEEGARQAIRRAGRQISVITRAGARRRSH
jgi:hypothetical protein